LRGLPTPTEKLLASTAVKERRPPLDTREAATYVNERANYLEKLRCIGGGPVYIKRKGKVKYDPDDLDTGKRTSTSQGVAA